MIKGVSLTNQEHDEFVINHENGDLLQLSDWAKTKELTGWYAKRIAVADDGQVLGVGQILFKKIKRTKYTLAYISRGFVANYHQTYVIKALLDEAIKVSKAEHAYCIKIDPDIELKEHPNLINALESIGFKHKGLFNGLDARYIQPRMTMVTDISPSMDEVIQSFDSGNRSEVRRSLKKGTMAYKGSREDLPKFHEIMKETGERNVFLTRSLSYFETIYDCMNPGGHMEVFFVKLDPNHSLKEITKDIDALNEEKAILKERNNKKSKGKLKEIDNRLPKLLKQQEEMLTMQKDHPNGVHLAGAMLGLSGHKAYYLYSGSTNDYREYLPNHLMQVTLMEYAKSQGATQYDFGGVSIDLDEDDPQHGLYQFKKVWGTELSEKVGEFDYVLKPIQYALFDKGIEVYRNTKKKLNKRKNK